MPRLPVLPTILVALCVAAMIALGFWQLSRRAEKEAALAQYAANMGRPEIAFPMPPVGDQYLFRRASANCLEVVGWKAQGGRAADGSNGWREIAECRTGAEGPALTVLVGIAHDPQYKPDWKGGPVTGTITHAPDPRPLIASTFSTMPKTLMLVADTPPAGLKASEAPDISSVPNNHLAYAVQWFLFAGVAVIIYLLALRRRQKTSAPN